MTFTVIVSTFGDPQWQDIASALAVPSVAEQTVDCELLVVHGDTLAAARNEGAARAAGDTLVFLDADDELDPGYLAAIAAVDPLDGLALRYPAVQYIDADGTVHDPTVLPSKRIDQGNWMVIGTAVSRRLFLRAGGFHEWALYEDWDLWWRCIEWGGTPVSVPAAVYRAWRSDGSRNEPDRATKVRTKRLIQLAHNARGNR